MLTISVQFFLILHRILLSALHSLLCDCGDRLKSSSSFSFSLLFSFSSLFCSFLQLKNTYLFSFISSPWDGQGEWSLRDWGQRGSWRIRRLIIYRGMEQRAKNIENIKIQLSHCQEERRCKYGEGENEKICCDVQLELEESVWTHGWREREGGRERWM